MAGDITVEMGISGTSLDINFVGFDNPDNNGRYICHVSSLQIGYSNNVLYIKQNGHTLGVFISVSQINSFNGSPVTSLNDILDTFKTLI